MMVRVRTEMRLMIIRSLMLSIYLRTLRAKIMLNKLNRANKNYPIISQTIKTNLNWIFNITRTKA